MQRSVDEEGGDETSSRDGRDTNPQEDSGGTEPAVPEPQPDLGVMDEYHPASTDSVEDAEDMEDQEDQGPLPADQEDEEEFIFLDPEHPLVQRQQAALSKQLSRQLERINQELKEKLATEKAESKLDQEIGVEMFRVQEQLARLQNQLDDRHQTKGQAEAEHRQAQDQLEMTKSRHSSTNSQDNEAKVKVSKLQAELDGLMLHLIFTQGVSEDLRSQVKTLNNTRSKAGAEKTQAEEQKLKQDLYVQRLMEEVDRLTQQVEMYDAQTSAQTEETQTAREALSEAEMEMESMLVVRKQLLQQWNSSLTGMRRRDEAFGAMQEAIRDVEHHGILLYREIAGCRKSTTAEQELNETLTLQLNCSQGNGVTLRKLISQKQAQQEALQNHYSTCLRTLRETERTIASLTKESSSHQANINAQWRDLEKRSAARLELENEIMTYIQQKLNHNKAAKYSQQLTGKITNLKNEKKCQLQQQENMVLTVSLECQQVSQQVDSLSLTQEALDEEIAHYNKLLTFNQNNISSFATLMEQKQIIITNYCDKIGQIMSKTGQEELGPLQMKTQALAAQTEDLAADIRSDRQLWMRRQGTLMGLTQDTEANSKDTLKLQMEFTALQQRKIRFESQIELEHREGAELERSLKVLRRDLVKLDTLLSKNGQLKEAMEEENAMTETDFIHRLKEAERESIEMQMRHEKTQEEKERLLNSLVEAERQIMLWEKKTQLLKETRAVVDSEAAHGDIQAMKTEIHRMEVRLNQLMKQQERLLRESEATVSRRETIVLRRDAITHSSHKQSTQGELSRVTRSRQRIVQETHKRAAECELQVEELQRNRASLSDRLGQQKQQLIDLCSTDCILESESAHLRDTKDANLARLVALQSRTKKLRSVCDGSYRASSTGESVGPALQVQTERIHATRAILHRLCEEFPEQQGALRRLSLTLAAGQQNLEQKTKEVQEEET
ncbi:coiled-coil domain-containing protein 40 [Brachyistius frenatus]|uniref:coiled-coil domain-containing protein 40 n=1 Tax=Brachyistius frenatus TaxID=100188 RepID=UPI0037E91F4E